MFGFGKLKRDVYTVAFSSLGLAIFLNLHWITPNGDIFSNFIAGVVLYVGSRLLAYFLSRK